MTDQDKKNVIEFYEEQIWSPSLPKSDTLTDSDLKRLKNTVSFAEFMLRTNYNECVNSIKDSIKRVLQ